MTTDAPLIAIACGGTGGHLFPGLAVAEQLIKRGCVVTLLVSPKEVDQQAVKSAKQLGASLRVVTLPAVGLQNRNYFSFGGSFLKSWLAARKTFRGQKLSAALAMGGFTSAPPILAAKQLGAKTFLHESNTIPGKANRWLSRFANQCFVGFPQAGARLRNRNVVVTGTPVRPQFQPRDAAECRRALGLDPERSTVLVMGGSQGASGVNDLIINTLPFMAARTPPPQFFHLSGPADVEKVRRAYADKNLKAVVHGFFGEMELALGAATLAVSRSGASSLAEIAAMRVPSILIPYPAATDDHQYYNALAFEETGAAHMVSKKGLEPKGDLLSRMFSGLIAGLLENNAAREKVRAALVKWHAPQAAEQIAETMLSAIAHETRPAGANAKHVQGDCGCGGQHRAELRAKTAA